MRDYDVNITESYGSIIQENNAVTFRGAKGDCMKRQVFDFTSQSAYSTEIKCLDISVEFSTELMQELKDRFNKVIVTVSNYIINA